MTHKNRYMFGLISEYIAMLLLMVKGYRILKHRYKTFYGEIDIIAKRGSLIAFVEVKGRGEKEAFDYAVSPQSRRRIENTAENFLKEHQSWIHSEMRFDVIFVPLWGFPKHVKRAWIFGD